MNKQKYVINSALLYHLQHRIARFYHVLSLMIGRYIKFMFYMI
jgi:hypothetical protein